MPPERLQQLAGHHELGHDALKRQYPLPRQCQNENQVALLCRGLPQSPRLMECSAGRRVAFGHFVLRAMGHRASLMGSSPDTGGASQWPSPCSPGARNCSWAFLHSQEVEEECWRQAKAREDGGSGNLIPNPWWVVHGKNPWDWRLESYCFKQTTCPAAHSACVAALNGH